MLLFSKIFEQAHKDGAEQFGVNWIEANRSAIDVACEFDLDNVLSDNKFKAVISKLSLAILQSQEYKYLILSGEGGFRTEHSFLMECDTLEEANEEFEKFKAGEYKDTYLFIYKAIKIKEQ